MYLRMSSETGLNQSYFKEIFAAVRGLHKRVRGAYSVAVMITELVLLGLEILWHKTTNTARKKDLSVMIMVVSESTDIPLGLM